MGCRIRFVSIVLVLVVLSCAGLYGRGSGGSGLATVNQYLDLLAAGNFEIAGDMWTPQALERSSRFGISYLNIPLKVDCSSPVIYDYETLRFHLLPPVKTHQAFKGGSWFRLEFSKLIKGQPIQHYYYAQKLGSWYWLAYPQDFLAGDWPTTESKYFRFHIDRSVERYVNEAVLAEADRFVEEMADTLDIPESMRRQMAERKIEYFYCSSDSVVEEITGKRVKGVLDLASNDIISAALPHFHEIVRLLVNIRLQELPLYTLPIMGEGVAVRYGGRWGKHTAALTDLGVFLYKEELVYLDSILTIAGFEAEAGADIVYPVSGVFCSFLIDRLGHKKYFRLYRRLSGTSDSLAALKPPDIKDVIVEATGHDDWSGLTAGFDKYIDKHITRYATALPGGLKKGKTVLAADRFTITEDKKWLAFEFKSNPDDESPAGNLLFAKQDGLVGQRSYLFAQQYRGEFPFEGYRFGVRFDRNEAGLYDYATNQLVAKYIWGITPSEEYFNAEQHTISIKFRKSLLNERLPGEEDYRLLPR